MCRSSISLSCPKPRRLRGIALDEFKQQGQSDDGADESARVPLHCNTQRPALSAGPGCPLLNYSPDACWSTRRGAVTAVRGGSGPVLAIVTFERERSASPDREKARGPA